MIKIKDIDVSYSKQSLNIISALSLEIKKGSITCILGQNGVGKSTLLRCLTRELVPSAGDIYVAGKPIADYTIKEYAQKVGVVASQSVMYQNLLVADYLLTGYANTLTPFEKPNHEKLNNVLEVLALFKKEDLFNKKMEQISSGEKQLVMISRAIVQNPDVILLDEPMANLDVKNQLSVLENICVLKDKGYTVVLTTHNPGHALALNEQVLLMGKGKYLVGATKEVVTEESLSECYETPVSIHLNEDYQSIIFHGDAGSKLKVIL